MSIMWERDKHCAGHSQCGTFVVTYDIPSGKQSCCHPSPGEPFKGTKRVAYIPGDFHGNDGGRPLVKRLRYAFMFGLQFMVGTSLTTGKSNRVVWASITHKTKTEKDIHGFPDPSFFANCNMELDVLGVPKADSLPSLMNNP